MADPRNPFSIPIELLVRNVAKRYIISNNLGKHYDILFENSPQNSYSTLLDLEE